MCEHRVKTYTIYLTIRRFRYNSGAFWGKRSHRISSLTSTKISIFGTFCTSFAFAHCFYWYSEARGYMFCIVVWWLPLAPSTRGNGKIPVGIINSLFLAPPRWGACFNSPASSHSWDESGKARNEQGEPKNNIYTKPVSSCFVCNKTKQRLKL